MSVIEAAMASATGNNNMSQKQRASASKAPSAKEQQQFKHLIITADDERFKQNQPRPKRHRISVACSECCARKVKCSGCRPKCKACQKNNSNCVYREGQEKAPSLTSSTKQNTASNRTSQEVTIDRDILSGSPPNSYVRTNRTPEFFASLAEHFDTFNNWPTLNVGSDGSVSPLPFSMPPPLDSQVPMQGQPRHSSDSTKVRIPYFRWFGPTGIVPGFTKVLVDLRQTRSEYSTSTTSSPAQTLSSPTSHVQNEPGLYQTPTPHPDDPTPLLFDHKDEIVPQMPILQHLLEIFFDYFSCHFPFYQRDSFLEHVRAKSVPAVLLNSMCALASRFSQHPRIRGEPIYLCGEVFGDKAKQVIFALLAVPSYDLVASLLILSWYEFGCNRDVGFWMYSGMAIRMAQDLGMHKGNDRISQVERSSRDGSEAADASEENSDHGQNDEEEDSMQLNLFWSIYFIDRIISLGTGRPLTLRDDQISCPLPGDGFSQSNQNIWPNPFPEMIRIMTIQGKANEEISTIRQPEDLTALKRSTLFALQDEIIQIYTNLDSLLNFKVGNFRNYVALGLGGSFLLLHVWFHAVIITLHRPGLMFGKGKLAHTLGQESLEVSMSSANTITAILGLAEIIDDKTIKGTPFLNQAIYIAGLAFIAESEMHGLSLTINPRNVDPGAQVADANASMLAMHTGAMATDLNSLANEPTLSSSSEVPYLFPSPTFTEDSATTFAASHTASRTHAGTASSSLLQFASKRNYETCLQVITTLKCFWRGIGWILSTMEQKAMGILQTDPSEESVDPESKIDLQDAGMLRSLMAVKRRRPSRGMTLPAAVLFPAALQPRNGEMWTTGKNQGWSTYGLMENGIEIGDTWVDLTWVDPSAPIPGFGGSRVDRSHMGFQS